MSIKIAIVIKEPSRFEWSATGAVWRSVVVACGSCEVWERQTEARAFAPWKALVQPLQSIAVRIGAMLVALAYQRIPL